MPRLPRLATSRVLVASQSAAAALAAVAALGLTACGPKAKPGGPAGPVAVPIPEGPGCPSAASVLVAVYHEATAGAPGTWTLPLANRATTETTPRFQTLDAAAAAAANIPAPPAKLWLMPLGAPPCEATPGAFYADTVVDGPANDVLGVQLTTACPAPGKEQPLQLLAIVADAAPTGCVSILPRPVAGRVGEVVSVPPAAGAPPPPAGAPPAQTWQVMAQSTPMPPAIAAAVPQKECAAPCEPLWTVAQLEFAGKPIAWDVSLEWLRADPAQPDVCQWQTERDGGIWVSNASGAAERLTHDHAVEPLHLGAVLADRSGAKVLVLEHIGEYATFDLTAGAAPQQARHLRWYQANEELYAGDRKLGPYCGP